MLSSVPSALAPYRVQPSPAKSVWRCQAEALGLRCTISECLRNSRSWTCCAKSKSCRASQAGRSSAHITTWKYVTCCKQRPMRRSLEKTTYNWSTRWSTSSSPVCRRTFALAWQSIHWRTFASSGATSTRERPGRGNCTSSIFIQEWMMATLTAHAGWMSWRSHHEQT